MKLYKSDVDDEIYYYFLKSGAQRWMYRHKYYDALGKRKEKKKSSFKSEKAALKALLEVKAALLSGQSRQIENDQMTVSQWLDIWYEIKEREWEVSTVKHRKRMIKNHFKPLLGKYKLSSLDKNTYVREFINKLYDKELESSTISLIHNIFNVAINAAVEDEIIPRNRFRKVTIEKDGELENYLSPTELNTFLNATKKFGNITHYTLILLLAYTGLRNGEASGLKWEDISFKNKSISVNRTRDEDGSRSPKTKRSIRTLKIDDILINQLKKYQKWCIETKFSYGMKLDMKKDYVFISYRSGEPINSHLSLRFIERLYETLEQHDIKLKRITPHGLRHTHASILISQGIPPTDVAKRLGNTIKMIYDVYSHSFKELEERTVIAFSEGLAGAKTGAN